MGIVAKVQKLGRIAIPQTMREFYNIEEGDFVEVEIIRIKKKDGEVLELSASAHEGVAADA